MYLLLVRFEVSVHLLVSWSRWLCKCSSGWATKWTAVSSGPRFYGRQSAARLITHYLSPLHFTWLCICISQVTHGPICIPGILPLRHWRSGRLAPYHTLFLSMLQVFLRDQLKRFGLSNNIFNNEDSTCTLTLKAMVCLQGASQLVKAGSTQRVTTSSTQRPSLSPSTRRECTSPSETRALASPY